VCHGMTCEPSQRIESRTCSLRVRPLIVSRGRRSLDRPGFHGDLIICLSCTVHLTDPEL
jgi:hypothetical protein